MPEGAVDHRRWDAHRGGPPGFVTIEDDRTLAIPDYPGNGMFKTLGNLAIEPFAALVFVDYARGDVLQLAGRTAPIPDPAGWRFTVDRWRMARGVAPAGWVTLEQEPRRDR